MFTKIDLPNLRATVKSWLPLEEIEPGALKQIGDAARHPDVASAMAVMPDCHVGFGVTIGSVFPTVNAVLPSAVGVDIGCGMCAIDIGVVLDRERMDKGFWRGWSGNVSRNVPSGFDWHKRAQNLGDLDRPLRATNLQRLIRERAAVQLGTLGGGNHFLEAQVAEDDHIWMMVHSGSRNTGLQIAGHYNKLAIVNSAERGLAAGRDLASLPLDDQLGQDYVHDMNWATDFALASRRAMLSAMLETLWRELERSGIEFVSTDLDAMINIHHNFANLEVHDGAEVMVHRKGATSAFSGQLGIIPGSMGSASYIVRGLGNEDSLKSCSHGAGRRMSRKSAKAQISDSDFQKSLEGTFSKASASYIDEAPGAYKDIDVVISRQTDLVDIVHTLRPLITVKGDSRAKED